MEWKIGNVKLDNQVVVAPMAGVTNTSYRKICKEMGASLVVAEMVSDKALVYGSKKTFDLLKMDEKERPISQQIFGSDDVDDFVKAAKLVEENMHPDIIDINMGCPVPKVALRAQAGSALLKDPEKIGRIVKAVVESVSCPVTVKIRSGWDEKSINAVEVAKIIEQNGASAIAVHARTRSQGYSGKADWNIIKDVVDNVSIPVIGNGDIVTYQDAKRMVDETGCTAVMIGRGILGNPWLIKESIEYLDGKTPSIHSISDVREMMIRHMDYLYSDKSQVEATLELRSMLMYYLKGLPNAKETKVKLCHANNRDEYLSIINEYFEFINNK